MSNVIVTQQRKFFDRQFFLIGAGLTVVLVLAFAWKVQSSVGENAAARRGASAALRAMNPDLAWAFDEWSACAGGTGRFAGKELLSRESCDHVVINHAKDPETANLVAMMFRVRDVAAVEDIEVHPK